MFFTQGVIMVKTISTTGYSGLPQLSDKNTETDLIMTSDKLFYGRESDD